MQREFDRQSHHLVEGHAPKNPAIRQSAPGNQNATAIRRRDVRIDLRRIPAIAVPQPLRPGLRGEFSSIESPDDINAVRAKENPSLVMDISIQREFKKV